MNYSKDDIARLRALLRTVEKLWDDFCNALQEPPDWEEIENDQRPGYQWRLR